MGKYVTVGSIYKKKDGTGDYIKFRSDVQVKEALLKAIAGASSENELFLNLQSKKSQLERLEQLASEGKDVTKARERVEKIPEYVRFEIVLVTE